MQVHASPVSEGRGGAALVDQVGEHSGGQADALQGQPAEGVNGVRELTSRAETEEGADGAGGRARVAGGSFSRIRAGREVIERSGRGWRGHWGEKP